MRGTEIEDLQSEVPKENVGGQLELVTKSYAATFEQFRRIVYDMSENAKDTVTLIETGHVFVLNS